MNVVRFPLLDERGASITLSYEWATGQSWASCDVHWPDSAYEHPLWRSGWPA